MYSVLPEILKISVNAITNFSKKLKILENILKKYSKKWWEPKCMRNSIFLLFALKKRLNRMEEACTNSSLSKRKPTKPQM